MGAFDYGRYRRGLDGREDARLGAAILAIKRELAFNGFARPKMDATLPFFGEAVENSVKDFQKSRGLTADGEVGQTTGRELFRPRIEQAEDIRSLPHGTIGKKVALESAFDPVAVGFSDAADKGIAQINTRIHGVTEAEAFSPVFAIAWAGDYVLSQKREVERRANTLRAGRAAYNVGNFYATEWMLAGFPENGRVENGIDWFARAHKYLLLVDAKEF
jgi:peptidoglycan hydrolase-like protein with peptidoglycan-binding domain